MLRLSLRASAALSLTLLVALTSAGCGGGGGGSSSSGTATPPSAAPDFGGNVTTISSATTMALSTTTLNAFAGFRNTGSVSDLVISPLAGLRDRAFVAEDKGSVRILALGNGTPTLDRVVNLEPTALASGTALGDLQLMDTQTGVVTASGNDAIYIFNPTSATQAVTKVDIDAVAVTWPAGTVNSVGANIGGAPRPLNYTASAVITSGRLIFCSSNLDASFNYDPGTVVALNYNATTRTATTTGASVIQTTRFNPSALTLVQTTQGPVLLVTNSGPFGGGSPASIDVIDPVAFRLVGQIGLGARSPGGAVAVSPDGRRGYVGSSATSEVYVLDLENIGSALASTTIADLTSRFRGGMLLPKGASAYISSVELSYTGNYLYAVDYNQSLVWVVDLVNPGIAAKSVGFRRTDTSGFSNSASKLAVRPGQPGTEFTGPSVFVLTAFLATADQTVSGVAMALDAVAVNRH